MAKVKAEPAYLLSGQNTRSYSTTGPTAESVAKALLKKADSETSILLSVDYIGPEMGGEDHEFSGIITLSG